MGKIGKPTKCTPERIEQIAEHVRNGVRDEVAAGCVGVGRSTHFAWMQRGEDEEDSVYADYRDAILRARDQWEAAKIRELNSSMVYSKDGSPSPVGRDRQWLLRHLRKEAFSEDFKIEVMDKAHDEILERLRTGLDPAAFEAALRVLVGASSGETPSED